MTDPTPPEPIRGDTPEQRLIRQKIWRACNVENQHFMAAIVGREGSGKSLTGLKLAEMADPSMSADRVMFEPKAFLERLQEWKERGETTGKMVVADEAGVGLGVRTWYQKDQILFNQVLQVIRDENMGIIFTLPRLNELDSQARGRLHAFIEMTDLDAGDWAEFRWLNWSPTRDERDDVYRHYPVLNIGGFKRKVKRLKVSPPSAELVANYQERKNAFQDELYQDAIDEMGDDDDDSERSASAIAEQIKSGDSAQQIVSWHNAHKRWYVAKDLVREQFDLSHSKAQTVKKLLENDPEFDSKAVAPEKREAEV